jgi:hypothetical protein
MFNPNQSSIPIGAKVEISPKGFTLGVKAEMEKIFSICRPKLLKNAELYGLVFAPKAEKQHTFEFGNPICNHWGPMFQHLLISGRQCSRIY